MFSRLPFRRSAPTVAVIRLQGAIAAGSRGLNDAALAPLIEKAFRRGKPKAVALQINSPGGSPVQSALIGARIRRLSDEHEVPVIAFVEDVAASGGYWLAASADEIFADDSSVLGSIGVIAASFGLHDAIGKIGVERRVHTAGTSKSMLDPFRPEKDEDVARLRRILDQIHETFIAHVKARRGAKLADADELFSGEIWVGARAVEVGLADGIGHLVPVMKERFGDKVRFRKYTQRRSLFSRFSASLIGGLDAEFEERAAFARYGVR